MTNDKHSVSFYLFDFDDNIMFLSTPVFLLNTVTKTEVQVSTGEFASIQPLLGRPGKWGDYAIFEGTYRNFRDIPEAELKPGQRQHLSNDIAIAVKESPDKWKAPSWDLLVYACEKQRPVSLVTARGHSPETLKAGIKVLVDEGLLPKEPNYHTVFPVGNPDVRREELGDPELMMTTPALKKAAIVRSVDLALEKYGAEPEHRFGMSDDDPQNVQLIISAMAECKNKYLDKRFFVINTHTGEFVKMEIFPIDYPVAGNPCGGSELA